LGRLGRPRRSRQLSQELPQAPPAATEINGQGITQAEIQDRHEGQVTKHDAIARWGVHESVPEAGKTRVARRHLKPYVMRQFRN
jgi:hypothetical protein